MRTSPDKTQESARMTATARRFAPVRNALTRSEVRSAVAEMVEDLAAIDGDDNPYGCGPDCAVCYPELHEDDEQVVEQEVSRQDYERGAAMQCYDLWSEYDSFEDFVAAHPYGWSWVGEGERPDFLFCYPSG